MQYKSQNVVKQSIVSPEVCTWQGMPRVCVFSRLNRGYLTLQGHMLTPSCSKLMLKA